jgi:homoserine dehydrogenase
MSAPAPAPCSSRAANAFSAAILAASIGQAGRPATFVDALEIIATDGQHGAEPLVVSGPGAGPAVTAAGILNDIFPLAAR